MPAAPRWWERRIGARVHLSLFGIRIGTGHTMYRIHHDSTDTDASDSDSEEVASDDQSAPLRPITSSVSHGKNEISSSSSPSHERSDTHASGVKDASDLMSMIQSAMTVQK